MKKNILIISILCLLCVTANYTYSALKNTIKGNITATSNKWKFSVNVSDGVIENSYYKVPIINNNGSFDIVLDNSESEYMASYVIKLEKVDLPNDFVIDNSTYEGMLDIESKTINVNYSSSSNVNGYILVKTEGKQGFLYGVKRDRNSTSTEWERIENSVGLVANAVLPGSTSTENDFDNIYPWSDIKSYNYDAKTKEITAWYGDSNFKFDGSNGEVLTYIPGFYYKREVIDDIEYQYISQYKYEGYSYIEPFSVGRYKISMVEDEISSRSGVKSLGNRTISEFRELVNNFGSEFSQMDWHYYVIQMLYLVEYADYDVQAKIGQGVTNASGIATMGGTDELGMKSGCLVNDGTGSSIYRGMEDLYSNVFEFIDGINIKDYQAYINYNYETYESDKFDGDYKALGYVNASKEGWITKIGYDSNNPLIGLPIEAGGSYDTSIKDYYWQFSGKRVLVAGGYYVDTGAGLWLSLAYSGSGDLNAVVGARLVKHQ